jgi:thiamine biosynthesis lipoprotein
MSKASEGKFDVTIQPLWKLHAATVAGTQQDAAQLAATCERVDWRQLTIESGVIRLERPGMAVTLNGIAQGFAADRVATTLKNHGVEQALVNTGEFAPLGSKADGRPWRIGIQHPRAADAFAAVIPLEGRCLATSGDYATRLNSASAPHHLLDPDTGKSASEFTSVSIVAPTGMLADALSTAVFVLGVEKGVRLIEATPGADLFGILPGGRTIRTRGFPPLAEDAHA